MHDFLFAKQIIDEVLKVIAKKKIQNIKSVSLEIGSVSLAHDGFDEHTEDTDLENLEFGISNLAKDTALEGAKVHIKKTKGESWKITDIEVE